MVAFRLGGAKPASKAIPINLERDRVSPRAWRVLAFAISYKLVGPGPLSQAAHNQLRGSEKLAGMSRWTFTRCEFCQTGAMGIGADCETSPFGSRPKRKAVRGRERRLRQVDCAIRSRATLELGASLAAWSPAKTPQPSMRRTPCASR